MSSVQKRVLGALCLALASACGEGLGECDQAMLGGSNVAGMVAPYDGQRLVAERCASGRCHSEGAIGDGRIGAPAELNFDVVVGTTSEMDLEKLRHGSATVIDWAEDMWGEIEEGAMPPPKPAGSGELNGTEKEQIRNWLACGAPVLPPDSGPPTATWDSIWSQLAVSCVGCHSEEAGPMIGRGFVLANSGDACTSYDNIMGAMAVTGECMTAGETIVVPGNPAGSLLYKKLTSAAADVCGDPMPIPSTMGLSESKPELVELIRQWIMNNAPRPAGCP